MKKSPLLYIFVILAWGLVATILLWQTVNISINLFNNETIDLWKKILSEIFLCGNCVCFLYFWLNSIKDLMFSVFYVFLHKKMLKTYSLFDERCKDTTKRILLLYCTCNDFNEEALLKSSQQDYPNAKLVILDDSSKQEYKESVDKFASQHNFEVVRRENHVGFKAGNLNNYLNNVNPDDYDYLVVLDSDEIIPNDFVSKILTYFEKDGDIGAVQTAHVASKSTNLFQEMLGMCVKSNGKVCQIMKNFYGSTSLFGHGMIISKECFKKVGVSQKLLPKIFQFLLRLEMQAIKLCLHQTLFVKNNSQQIIYP